MRETKKGTKKSVSSTSGQAIAKRILVADDDHVIKEIISAFLEFLGFEVALAANGIEALAAFLDRSFDLVLTDLQIVKQIVISPQPVTALFAGILIFVVPLLWPERQRHRS